MGAGSEMRHTMGNAVFSGMIGVTIFGLLFKPVFYILLSKSKKQQVATSCEIKQRVTRGAMR